MGDHLHLYTKICANVVGVVGGRVRGIMCVVVDDKRHLKNISSGETRLLQLNEVGSAPVIPCASDHSLHHLVLFPTESQRGERRWRVGETEGKRHALTSATLQVTAADHEKMAQRKAEGKFTAENAEMLSSEGDR